LQFSNILGKSKRHQNGSGQNGSIWPPSEEMMDQCDDLSRWTISAGVDPYKDIKATVVDPWDKAYLLTIPANSPSNWTLIVPISVERKAISMKLWTTLQSFDYFLSFDPALPS
jgi:hypothetical protein